MIATADLYDERGTELDSVSVPFRDLGGRTVFDGPARTVRCHRDNALIKALLATPGDGAVLVVDGGGSLESALVGDVIAGSALANGWAGVIVHGAVRDSEALAGLDLGVKALGTNPRKSAKEGVGEVDVPVHVGDVLIRPGAHVWADADGILVEAASAMALDTDTSGEDAGGMSAFRVDEAFSGFSVDDLDAAREFYGRTLGLTVETNTMGFLEIRLPSGGTILVYDKPNHEPAGYTVLNFPVSDIDAAVADLNARGVVTKIYADEEFPTEDDGILRGHGRGPDIAWFRDPAGNVLAVLQN